MLALEGPCTASIRRSLSVLQGGEISQPWMMTTEKETSAFNDNHGKTDHLHAVAAL